MQVNGSLPSQAVHMQYCDQAVQTRNNSRDTWATDSRDRKLQTVRQQVSKTANSERQALRYSYSSPVGCVWPPDCVCVPRLPRYGSWACSSCGAWIHPLVEHAWSHQPELHTSLHHDGCRCSRGVGDTGWRCLSRGPLCGLSRACEPCWLRWLSEPCCQRGTSPCLLERPYMQSSTSVTKIADLYSACSQLKDDLLYYQMPGLACQDVWQCIIAC